MLTDTAARNAKSASRKTRKLSDSGGLQLWVTPTGKTWCFAYRYGGKQKKLTIGGYPAISLAEAREARDEAKRLLARDIDPSRQKRIDKLTKANAEANTFSAVAAELLDRKRREGKAESTIEQITRVLAIAENAFGERPIASLAAPELLDLLRKVEQSGRIETARRVRARVGEVFRFAIATGRAESDPTFALRGAIQSPRVTHRAAITDREGLGGLLRAIDGYRGQPAVVAAFKLLAYLFPRPGELRLAEWGEFDLDAAEWNIPATRMKMRRPHRIPLPPQAVEVLRSLRALTNAKGEGLVFAGYGMSGGEGRKVAPKPISENTLNAALRRMGYSSDEMTSHGFRAAASTILNESGKFSADAIERALAHQDADAARRAYARGQHWAERVEMMKWWADYLDALRAGSKAQQNSGASRA